VHRLVGSTEEPAWSTWSSAPSWYPYNAEKGRNVTSVRSRHVPDGVLRPSRTSHLTVAMRRGSRQVPVQTSQQDPKNRPVLQPRAGDLTSRGCHRSAQPGTRAALARLSGGSGPPGQPQGAPSTHTHLRVGPESRQVSLVERVSAAPAVRAGHLLVLLRNGGHRPILAFDRLGDQWSSRERGNYYVGLWALRGLVP
jgi:hypothetical protein